MNQISKNMIWNTISVLITSVISFTLTPYVTKHIGIEATGFITLANTVVGYIDIIVIALNAFAIRNIAIAYHNKNYEEVNQYYSSVLISNVVLITIVNFICFYLVMKLDRVLNISNSLVNDVKILFFIILINYSINVFGNIFTISAFVKNNTSITYRNKGIGSLLYMISLVMLIYFSTIHVYYIAVANMIAALTNLILNYYSTKKLMPNLKINIHKFSIEKIKTLISSGIWNSINNIGVLLNSGLDLLVTNKMLSVIIMGQISVSKQLSSIMTTVTGIIVNSFQPKQLEKYAKGDIKGLVIYLKSSIKLSSVLTITIFSCFFVLGRDFLNLWIPNQNIEYIYNLCVIVIFGDIVVAAVRPLYYVFTLTDNLKITCFFTIVSGILNFISMILLIVLTDFGGYAVVGTTCILNFITNLIITPYLASHFLKLKNNTFYPILIKHVLICFSVTFVLYLANTNFIVDSWIKLLISGSINAVIVLLTTGMLITTKKEKKLLIKKIIK